MFRLCEGLRAKSLCEVRTLAIASKFAMCEQTRMSDKPGTTELATVAGISKSYASEILNDQRAPSRPLAIHIYRKTGWKHSAIAELTDEQMEMLEQIEPWTKAA